MFCPSLRYPLSRIAARAGIGLVGRAVPDSSRPVSGTARPTPADAPGSPVITTQCRAPHPLALPAGLCSPVITTQAGVGHSPTYYTRFGLVGRAVPDSSRPVSGTARPTPADAPGSPVITTQGPALPRPAPAGVVGPR